MPTASTTPFTLRALYGVPRLSGLDPDHAALVLVDFQYEFFEGPLALPDGRATLAVAIRLLHWARSFGVLVVHVQHRSTKADSPVFAAASAGVEPVADLTPRAGELVVAKSVAGAFSRTNLDRLLHQRAIDTLFVAGLMTHLAVDTTARDAAVLGYRVVVVADGCATRDLPGPDGEPIDRDTLHRATLAALADRFADVLVAAEVLALPVVE